MSDHEWCRDVQRDEAVRAAEDAAAVPAIQHRDLPEAVAELRERVARMEAAVTPKSVSLPNAEGLRTERVTLEVTQRTESYAPLFEIDWESVLRQMHRGGRSRGESVRVVEEPAEIALLTAERDLARAVRDGLRSQRDAARARVAELEAAPAASGAAVGTCNTFCGERECERTDPTQCKRGAPQPARGGLTAEEREASTEAMKCMTKLRRERDAARARVAELEAAPPPRGWLTDEDRRAVAFAAKALRGHAIAGNLKAITDQLDGLLARETPPRVKVPSRPPEFNLPAWNLCLARWIAAVREAGGEVEG